MSEITKRLLTDDTGQEIVGALEDLALAVKPTGAEIDMSSTDTTKIKDAIETNSEAIAMHKNDIASLDELKTELLAFVGNLSANDTRRYAFWVGGSSSPFSAGYIYSGTIYVSQKTGSVIRFNAIFSNDNGQSVVVGYNNGTWNIQSIDQAISTLNSNIAKISCGTYTTVASYDALKTLLNNTVSAMSNFEVRNIIFSCTSDFETFGAALWTASITKNANDYFSALCYPVNKDGNVKLIRRQTTSWYLTDYALKSELSTTSPTVTKTANIKTNSVVSAKRNANVVSIYMDVYAVSTSSEYVNIASLSEAPSTNVYFVMIDPNDGAKMCRLTSGGTLQIHGTVADRNYMGSLIYIVNS